MEGNCKTPISKCEFDKKLLSSFALFLSSEIKQFYQSEEGKQYYENWIKEQVKNLLKSPPSFWRWAICIFAIKSVFGKISLK